MSEALLLRQRALRYWSMRSARLLLGATGQLLPYGWKRRMARKIPRLAYLFRHQGELVIDDYGGDIRVQIDVESAIERQMLSGLYEPGTMRVIESYVKPGSVCVDIGANVGGISLILARQVGAAGRVHCFEPGPRFFRRLQDNFGLNPRLAERVSLHNLGISDREGKLFWAEDPHFPGNAWMLGSAGLPVEVVALDSFIQANPMDRLDFIKVDVEGMEYEALTGATETLKRFRPVILFETLMVFEDVRGEKVRWKLEQWLRGMGYEVFAVRTGGRLEPARYPDLPETCLAVPLS